MSTLYIIATPIGNLDDLTIRAVEVLRTVPVVVAEDTRITSKLLDHVDANPKVLSFHRRARSRDVLRIMKKLDEGDAALVSDAGTPGVNDPGQIIVEAAIDRGHSAVPIPGASSIMVALSVSGFYADQFVSHGFLSSSGAKRRRLLRGIAADARAAVFFETPHRLRDALADIAAILEGRQIVVCREMTKLHEEIWRGTAEDALRHFQEPRGEFVIVVAPLARTRGGVRQSVTLDSKEKVLAAAAELSDTCNTRRDLADAIADQTRLPRRLVYQILHRQQAETVHNRSTLSK